MNDVLELDLDKIKGCLFKRIPRPPGGCPRPDWVVAPAPTIAVFKISEAIPPLQEMCQQARTALLKGQKVVFTSIRRKIWADAFYFYLPCCEKHARPRLRAFQTWFDDLDSRDHDFGLLYDLEQKGEQSRVEIKPYYRAKEIANLVPGAESKVHWIREISLMVPGADYTNPATKIKPKIYLNIRTLSGIQGRELQGQRIRVELKDGKWWWPSKKQWFKAANGPEMAKRTKKAIASGKLAL